MKAMAQSPDKARLAARAVEPNQYLTFALGPESFAIDIRSVTEIIEYGALTSVPMMPPSIRGMIHLRGAVTPVMDLQTRFGRGQSPIGKRSCVVIVETAGPKGHQVIGVLVDSVRAVVAIPASDIEPAPTYGGLVRTDFIRGVGKHNDSLVVILDPDHALSAKELEALANAALAEPAGDAEPSPFETSVSAAAPMPEVVS